MTDIKDIIDKIIPAADYQHRNGFSNGNLIDKLSSDEKNLLETELINRLAEQSFDDLVIETLTYLQSNKAVEPLKNKLKDTHDTLQKIIIAANLFKITADKALMDIAVDSFKTIEALPMNYFNNRSTLISSFYYLTMFQDKEINKLISPYSKNSDMLVSYNAKRYLGQQD